MESTDKDFPGMTVAYTLQRWDDNRYSKLDKNIVKAIRKILWSVHRELYKKERIDIRLLGHICGILSGAWVSSEYRVAHDRLVVVHFFPLIEKSIAEHMRTSVKFKPTVDSINAGLSNVTII